MKTARAKFEVLIRGAGKRQIYKFKAEVAAMDIDDPQPVIYVSLEDED